MQKYAIVWGGAALAVIALIILAIATKEAEPSASGTAEREPESGALLGEPVVYRNMQYDFIVALPDSWRGYSVVTDVWEGRDASSREGVGTVIERGPIIFLRHPQWTAVTPRQDIPVMVFTVDQWKALQKGEFHIGAAPINPSELSRNSRYVFGLPARYNFAGLPGLEEVGAILESGSIKALERRP